MLSAAADALRAATAQLAPTSPTPRLDAELLMAHALDMARPDLLLRLPDLAEPTEFAALLARRAAQEPIAYIVGHQDFWDMTLDVTPDVLIPRADSETLIEAAQDMLGWNVADRAPFAAMLAHPRIVPYLNEICGRGFRMDHAPTLIQMDAGDGAQLGLHGSSGPGFDPKQYYVWKDGQMHNGLVVVNWMLCDQGPGDGGFAW